MTRAWLVAVVAVAGASCWDNTYHCTHDAECVLGGTAGRCEPSGVCSLPSASCPSGWVYAPHSSLSGSCVPGAAADLGVATCGNGVLDPGEACDPNVMAPNPGVCPMPGDCDDHNPCTTDAVSGSAADCSAQCTHTFITACGPADGCCPTGCTPVTDGDCSSTCGNGRVDGSETCDKAIAPGQPGACPTSCPPKSGCDSYTLIGDPSVCTAACVKQTTTTCSGALTSDGCCPPGCSLLNDADCA